MHGSGAVPSSDSSDALKRSCCWFTSRDEDPDQWESSGPQIQSGYCVIYQALKLVKHKDTLGSIINRQVYYGHK